MLCSFFSFNSVAFGNTGRDYVERSIKEIHMIKLMTFLNSDMHDYYVTVRYIYVRSQLTIAVCLQKYVYQIVAETYIHCINVPGTDIIV